MLHDQAMFVCNLHRNVFCDLIFTKLNFLTTFFFCFPNIVTVLDITPGEILKANVLFSFLSLHAVSFIFFSFTGREIPEALVVNNLQKNPEMLFGM